MDSGLARIAVVLESHEVLKLGINWAIKQSTDDKEGGSEEEGLDTDVEIHGD